MTCCYLSTSSGCVSFKLSGFHNPESNTRSNTRHDQMLSSISNSNCPFMLGILPHSSFGFDKRRVRETALQSLPLKHHSVRHWPSIPTQFGRWNASNTGFVCGDALVSHRLGNSLKYDHIPNPDSLLGNNRDIYHIPQCLLPLLFKTSDGSNIGLIADRLSRGDTGRSSETCSSSDT